MNVTIKRLTPDWLFRRACEMTMHGQKSKISLAKLAQCEHSPLRTVQYWIEMEAVPSFVSVHFVRHHIGIEHFVQSMRDDLYITPETKVDRDTPVRHGMLLNAHSLINIARKRLCYMAHPKAVAAMRRIVKQIQHIDPQLAPFLVPECVYRNGYCPELRECKPGLNKVLKAYGRSDLIPLKEA